jgi:pimeloyl-ACP methyl ester carboxylesterase
LKIDIGYEIIALDLPSHYNSDDFEELNLELYTNVVIRLIDVLKLKKVILAGHSLGGAIIQNLYFQYREKVSGLILIGTGGRLRVSPSILNTLKNDYQKYLGTLFIGGFSCSADKAVIKEAQEEASKVSGKVTYYDYSICDNFDMLDKVHLISVPCLIIVGNDDILTPTKYSEFFHKKIRASELYIIKDAGHMVMIEKPKEVNSVIKNFITKYIK